MLVPFAARKLAVSPSVLSLMMAVLVTACTSLTWVPPLHAAADTTQESETEQQPQSIRADALFASMLVNAENGNPKAMLNVGSLYEQGLGIPRNFTKALEWYAKAANAGETEAYARQALCYEIGMGTAADQARALALYEKAASLGHAPSQYKLAGIYLAGRGTPRDEAKALALLRKAAEAGDPAAAFDLGHSLRAGLFDQKAAPDQARGWFAKAAEAGNAQAVLVLAAMLRAGEGGKADLEGALRWYLVAQKAGVQVEGLDEAVADLRKQLSKTAAQKADKDAEAWIAQRRAAKPVQE